MERKVVVLFFSMLLIGTVISVSGYTLEEKYSAPMFIDKTLYVGGSGPGNYSTIQDAVDNATYLDTIFVYSGTYNEHVKLHTTVTLKGEDRESTVIDAGGTGDVIYVTADNVKITGFSIINSGVNWPEAGIELHFIEHCTITDNIISNCGFGILPYVTTDVTISSNIIVDNDFGIHPTKTTHSNFSGNSFQNNRRGIYLNAASFIDIMNNNFINNSRHLDFYGAFRNNINDNYWQRYVNIGPKLIIGFKFALLPIRPGFLIDWNPASEPYDI
jgi:parallel beta-helix repeat protein